MPPPMASARMISPMPPVAMPGRSKVATMAIAMPTMPKRLPRREVSGWESPRSARMKRTAATRYASVERVAATDSTPLLGLEHRQHASGDDEAAEDVHRGERGGEEAEDLRRQALAQAG